MCESGKVLRIIANEHSDLFDLRGQLAHDLADSLWCDVPRTLFIKHKSQRIRAGLNRGECIFEISDPANLYPSHEAKFPVFGCQFPVSASLILRSIPGTRAAPPQEALSMLLRAISLSSMTRRSGMIRSRPRADG